MGNLKKLHGYYPTTPEWLPIKVDADGKVVLSPDSSGLIPQYLIAKWDYNYGAIPTGWSLYETGDYSNDLLTGGTPSADSFVGAGFEADKACDNNASTYWQSASTALPHWWKYNLSAAVSHIITKLTISGRAITGNLLIKDFTLQGSNDNISYTVIYTGTMANSTGVQTFTFDNNVSYRYYKVNITSTYYTPEPNVVEVFEFEMMKLLPAWIIKD